MAITYTPKVGEVLECDFGNFHEEDPGNLDYRVPPEMVKRRMAVVLNGKLACGGCLVVPISSKKHFNSIQRGLHVPLSEDLFRVTQFYDKRERWAKTELIQQVSKQRLFKLLDGGSRFDTFLPRELVADIQKAVIKSISASSLLQNP